MWRHMGGLVFTQQGVLAAYFVVNEGNTNLSARNRPSPADPYHLRAVFLGAESGKTEKVVDWPTRPNSFSSLFAARSGRFIVFAGDALSLYSPDISLLARYVPPWLGKAVFGTFIVRPSPAGDTLLLSYCEGRQGRCVVKAQLLDASTFSSLGSLVADRPDLFTFAWGEEAAWVKENYVYLWEPGIKPRILAHGTWLLGPPIAFLNADTLAVRSGLGGHDSELVILSTRGSILRRLRLGPEVADFVIPSQGGKFFALDSHIPGWFDSPQPRRVTIRVFRVDGQGPLLRLDVPERRFPSAVALSPDGSLLALTVGTVVRVYRVPIPPAQAGGK
jgi:hypothetical protein